MVLFTSIFFAKNVPIASTIMTIF